MNSWLYLLLAITLEVTGTIFLKLSEGFTKVLPSVAMLFFYALGLMVLAMALKKIDIGVAYAVWSGLGTALIATIGIFWFQEPLTIIKIISIGLIILGVIGLNVGGQIQ
ncbi:MAG: hypothetical protein BWK79_19660 [Beggiatoa sp. IS2]|nr:MAG: hypothetical protein BWK79_19660 [Beggiatoa sp. IS2]